MGERLSTTSRMTAENQRAAGAPFTNGLKSPNLNLISCLAPRLPGNPTRSRKRRLGHAERGAASAVPRAGAIKPRS
jgi:hypothetical protein